MRVSDNISTLIEDTIVTNALFTGFIPLHKLNNITSFERGIEVGITHGYFLVGPFYILSPTRNSNYGLIISLVSTLGLIIIVTLALPMFSEITKNVVVYKKLLNISFEKCN